MPHRRSVWSARGAIAAAALLASILNACIPYTVGTTAEPVAPGEHLTTMAITVMPSVALLESGRSGSYLGVDGETRRGIDSVSDVGFRLVSASGVVVNYKRLLTRGDSSGLIALMPGFGFVNLGQHAHFELTLLASGRMARRGAGSEQTSLSRVVPYGGLRVMQVAPLAEGAVHDRPTFGGFVGLRIGTPTIGVSPELGVFHDQSALGVRDNPIVVVPSVSIHGDELIDLIRRLPRPGTLPTRISR